MTDPNGKAKFREGMEARTLIIDAYADLEAAMLRLRAALVDYDRRHDGEETGGA